MATYAAYRHVELDKVGCGKRSIMKPPGGDCHDIFGADFHGTPSHHRVLKPPGGGTSGLFSTSLDEADKPRTISTASEGVTPQGSHASVNGTEGKANGMNGKSGNESLSDEAKGSKGGEVISVSTDSSSLSADLNVVPQEDKRPRDGNPVTGEGYDTPETQAPAPQRVRIPPGGYSSGLW